MKNLLIATLLLLLSSAPFAQELNYTVTFYDVKGKPITNTEVTCTEIETRKVIKQMTNSEGTTTFNFTEGKLWQMDILEIKNYYMWQLKVPQDGGMNRSQTITYSYEDYLLAMRPPIDRSKIDFEVLNQKLTSKSKPQNESILRVVMTKQDRKTPLRKLPIQLTCYETEKQYRALTNSKGIAYFSLPLGYDYDIDIEGINGYDVVSISDKGAAVYTNKFSFVPINFKETIKDNVVTQQLAKEPKPTSGRYLLQVYFEKEEVGYMKNTEVFINELEGDLKYKATTDENGMAYFMLPKKKTYVYNYPKQGPFTSFEEVADLTRSYGVSQGGVIVKIKNQVALRETKVKLHLPKSDKEFNSFFKSKNFTITNFTNKTIPYYAQSHLLFEDATKSSGLEKGLLMTTGNVLNALGPNDSESTSGANAYYIYPYLPETLKNGEGAYDPCIIEFDITPNKKTKKLTFDFVLGSEEYPEYINFDDAFGAFISGGSFDENYNFATFHDTTRLSITHINHTQNTENYVENLAETTESFKTWQYDGFTKVLTKELNVSPKRTYHVKFIIFDRIDNIYDSGVFINIR